MKQCFEKLTQDECSCFTNSRSEQFSQHRLFLPILSAPEKIAGDLPNRASDLVNGVPGVFTAVGIEPQTMSLGPGENISLVISRGPTKNLCR